MVTHPAICILALIPFLIIFYKRSDVLFKCISLLIPFLAILAIYYLQPRYIVYLCDIPIIYEGNIYNKIIGIALVSMLLCANIYSCGQNKKLEIIIGNSYGAFAMLCLFAGDLISLFVGLELMMLCSTMIIFIGGNKNSILHAGRYFITHLLSANLILLGVVYIISHNHGTEIQQITPLLKWAIESKQYFANAMLHLMLIGLLINIAVFPFSGWMTNYYPSASGAGFLYLISFTTKISIIALVKLFSGYENLVYISCLMIIYASIKVILEDNLLSVLCLLSIITMGVILAALSKGGVRMIDAAMCYITIHIIYKGALSLAVVSIRDYANIHTYIDLQKIDSYIIKACVLLAIGLMINFPLLISFDVKSYISHAFNESNQCIYYILLLGSISMVFTLPLKEYISSERVIKLNLNIWCKISILMISTIVIIIGYFGFMLFDAYKLPMIDISNSSYIKQLIIICATIIISYYSPISRRKFITINVIEKIESLVIYLNKDFCMNYLWHRCDLHVRSAQRIMLKILPRVNTQKDAVFLVFVVLITYIIIF